MFWGIGEVSKSRLPNKNSDPPILVKVLGKKKQVRKDSSGSGDKNLPVPGPFLVAPQWILKKRVNKKISTHITHRFSMNEKKLMGP